MHHPAFQLETSPEITSFTMQYSTSFVILSIAASSLCHPLQSAPVIRDTANAGSVSRICGTGPPGVALRDTHAQLHRESRNITLQPRKADGANEIVVDTYMHVVTTFDQAPSYTPEGIANLVSNQVCFSFALVREFPPFPSHAPFPSPSILYSPINGAVQPRPHPDELSF